MANNSEEVEVRVLGRMVNTSKGTGQAFLLLLWLVVGATVTALVLFLMQLGATFFYAIDWWVLGAILRVGMWVIGIPVAIALVVGLGVCLFHFVRAISMGKTME